MGKYTDWRDSYKSLSEALVHGGVANDVRVNMLYIDPKKSKRANLELLRSVDGILGSWRIWRTRHRRKDQGDRIRTHRERPLLRHLSRNATRGDRVRKTCLRDQAANSAEFIPEGKENVIDLMESQKDVTDKGGTMRLGAYVVRFCQIQWKTDERLSPLMARSIISERHRHRFEVSNKFRPQLEEKGLLVSGKYLE